MGWDTQIIIIAENIESKESSKEIGKLIFEKDSKRYGNEHFYIIDQVNNNAIYYSYERRKYAPYWVIEEISKMYPTVTFTLLGSMLDFLCGPGGVFRIKDGRTLDSYGIYGENSKRHQIIDSPIESRFEIYNWFQQDGQELVLRMQFLQEYPLGSSNDNLIDKIIPIDGNITEYQILEKYPKEEKNKWTKQSKFELIMSIHEYQELINTGDQIGITEQSFIAYIEYSNYIERIEERIMNIVKGEIIQVNPLTLYLRTFATNHRDKELIQNEFKYLKDFDLKLEEYENEIVEWGLRNLKGEVRLVKGFPITWMINVIKENKKASS